MTPPDVDGVPVLFAPSPGPMRAGLVFRVGVADETAATVGITHLVEHLALHRLGVADYHYNGSTSATVTQFVTQGTPETVTGFLHGVCAGLRALPVDRLPVERKLIASEAAGRGTPVNLSMPFWRHGARDYGLVSLPEYGVHTVTAEQVLEQPPPASPVATRSCGSPAPSCPRACASTCPTARAGRCRPRRRRCR